MNSPSATAARSRDQLLPALALMGGFTLLGDFLFWAHPPGTSVALFFIFAAASLYANHGPERPTRTAWIAGGLLLAASWATCLETSFSNLVVLVVLLAVIMGERHFRELPGGWARWSESWIAWALAGGRWWWFWQTIRDSELANVSFSHVTSDRAARSIQILGPAMILSVIFAIVLSIGNAVFRQMITHLNVTILAWVTSIDFSPVRIVLWFFFGTLALAFIRPRGGVWPRWWTSPISRISRPDTTVALWQSCAVFVALNGMFFVVNTIDAVYLWTGNAAGALPIDVSHSAYVHQGIYSLIFAVLLSAIVIAVIFQQVQTISGHRVLKMLAQVWIVQNMILIAGVFLRLKMYVDAFQLSELRVYVACFLSLVTVGFVLLAIHVERGQPLSTLLWRNVLATFTLFFALQFADVAGFVAGVNVSQWKASPARVLDLAYLHSLGAPAWPALGAVALTPLTGEIRAARQNTVEEARELVRNLTRDYFNDRPDQDWRSFQARRSANSQILKSVTARLDSPPAGE